MEGWLEWFEERCAILEFDAGISRSEAERIVAGWVLDECKKTGKQPTELMTSRYGFHFYGLLNMGVRVIRDIEVVEYRWRMIDGCVKLYHNLATDEEAHALFGERWHERVDETRRVGKRAIYRE